MRLITMTLSAVLATTAACASTPGAKPQDMSAAQHEEMAKGEENASKEHLAQFDPAATKETKTCGVKAGQPCWTSEKNPTAEHATDWQRHQKAAADHRAASQALRDAEARNCVGIPDADRDMSPFDHREDISGVEDLRGPVGLKGAAPRLEGSVVHFRAVQGMTAQWLQRVVDCHLARNAALGHQATDMPSCPLVPKGATATVSATATGFDVAIRGSDPAAAEEIGRRAKTLVTK